MVVKLHRCRLEWLKRGPCWEVEKALEDMGTDYELAPGPSRPNKRHTLIEHTGQKLYPAIEFPNGTWYREESTDMAKTIRDGKLIERASGAAPPAQSSTTTGPAVVRRRGVLRPRL